MTTSTGKSAITLRFISRVERDIGLGTAWTINSDLSTTTSRALIWSISSGVF